LVNLYVDADSKQDSYSESSLESLLLEYIFRHKDRSNTYKKFKRLFRQERLWKNANYEEIPPKTLSWLRDTLLKIYERLGSKKLKEHIEEYFGEKSDSLETLWAALDMAQFPDNLTILDLNSGGMEKATGKTSQKSQTLMDRRYKLNDVEKNKIRDEILDTSLVSVEFEQKSANIKIAIINRLIKIKKDNIFEKEGLDFKAIEVDGSEEQAETAPLIKFTLNEWADIQKEDTDSESILKDLWKKIVGEYLDEAIYNPYVNYELDIRIEVDMRTIAPNQNKEYEPRVDIIYTYTPTHEIKKLGKAEDDMEYNASRWKYLNDIKSRYNLVQEKAEKIPEVREEEE
jgi:hypothetical protein